MSQTFPRLRSGAFKWSWRETQQWYSSTCSNTSAMSSQNVATKKWLLLRLCQAIRVDNHLHGRSLFTVQYHCTSTRAVACEVAAQKVLKVRWVRVVLSVTTGFVFRFMFCFIGAARPRAFVQWMLLGQNDTTSRIFVCAEARIVSPRKTRQSQEMWAVACKREEN